MYFTHRYMIWYSNFRRQVRLIPNSGGVFEIGKEGNNTHFHVHWLPHTVTNSFELTFTLSY